MRDLKYQVDQSGKLKPNASAAVLLGLTSLGALYWCVLLFTELLRPYRFPVPYAVPMFDTPFALVAVGIGYLCLERHRLRQDIQSAALGVTLWLAALLALAHILTQPDYPGTPGVHAGVAPYFFFLSYLAGFTGIGLAIRYRERQLPLSDRTRAGIGLAVFGLSILIVIAVLQIRPLLPSLVMSPGRLTPFAVRVVGVTTGVVALFALWAGPRVVRRDEEWFAGFLVLAGSIWLIGLIGFLLFPFRYAVSWYLAGLARPVGVGVIFVGLLREQVTLYREARANLGRLQETQAQLIQADKLKALGTLLSGMAHELNNPLSTIQLSVQLIKRQQTVPDTIRTRLDTVEAECERASKIIKDLLTFARRKPPERRRVDLNEVIRSTLSLETPELELQRIRVAADLQPLPRIWADPQQLQQVFLNLFTNAAHALNSIDGERLLRVHTWLRGSDVCVKVEDNGPGIPSEHLGRVFDPFFTTKAAGEGTGLGLSLSIGIVEAHGGRMSADSASGAGAHFTITLPVEQRMGERVERPPAEPGAAGRAGKVLVVDDEHHLRKVLHDVLTTLGHDVDEAATGQEAIGSMTRQRYDLVSLDLRLPDIDGEAVWQWIRNQDPELARRVIFITGDTMSPETQKFLQEAGRPVLRKPLTIDRIRSVVDEILAAAPSARP